MAVDFHDHWFIGYAEVLLYQVENRTVGLGVLIEHHSVSNGASNAQRHPFL